MSRVAVLLIIALIVTTGCLGLELSPFEDPEADEVRDEAVTSVGDLETYSFETDIFTEINIPTEDGLENSPEITMTFGGSGEVDTESRTMRMDLLRKVDMTAETRESSAEVYLADGSVYVNDGGGWVRDERENFEATWRAHDMARITVDELREADVNFTDQQTETVDGTEAYVVSVEKHRDDYAESILERIRLYLAGETDTRFNVSEAQINEASSTVWVDKETMYPLRSESDVSFEASVDTGEKTVGMSVSLDSSMDISSHDEPVDHDLPEPP